MKQTNAYSLTELCDLVDLPRRTVRYYIQEGLLDPPMGAGRGAKYHRTHLEPLLEIRKWQDAGLSLERIRELLTTGEGEHPVPHQDPKDLAAWRSGVISI